MIVLHGRGDSMRPFLNFNEELKMPEMNYLLLNAPRKFLSGYSWYSEPPAQRKSVLLIREKFHLILADLEAQGWKSENIFLLGFSQGCLVSADLVMSYPKKFAGIVGVSGYFHFYPRWQKTMTRQAKKTPWLMTHGHRDDVLKLEDTKFGIQKLINAGLEVQLVELDKAHDFEEEEYPIIRKWIRSKIKSSGDKKDTRKGNK